MSATQGVPPYQVTGRPNSGLATITDRRDGTTGLWSRSLRRIQGVTAMYQGCRCANCGGGLRGGF